MVKDLIQCNLCEWTIDCVTLSEIKKGIESNFIFFLLFLHESIENCLVQKKKIKPLE